jgi:hypothetical protein
MNAFFKVIDGKTWVSKVHLKRVIRNTLRDLPNKNQCQKFSNIIIRYLDSLHYYEEPGKIKLPSDPEVDCFYCGSCRRHFTIKSSYNAIRSDIIPCSTCGAQASLIPKVDEEKTNEKEDSPQD